MTPETLLLALALGAPALPPAVADSVSPSLVTLTATSPIDSLVEMMRRELRSDVRLRLPEGHARVERTRSATAIAIDAEGHFVTAACFVTPGWPMTARLAGGEEVEAIPVGIDPESDIAVLRIAATHPPPPAPWEAGPLGLEPGVPLGILGAGPDTRCRLAEGRLEQALLHPAAGLPHDYLRLGGFFEPQSAGAAVISGAGRVVGMVSARARGGRTLAVPSPTVLRVAAELLARGGVTRGWFGVTTVTGAGFEAPARGVRVTGVVDGSPAEKCGIRPGDVIVRFAGKPVTELGGFVEEVGASVPGIRVKISFLREGEEHEAEATLVGRPAASGLGGVVVRLAERTAYLGVEPVPAAAGDGPGQVQVAAVDPGGPAQLAGVRPGDMIRGFDGSPLLGPLDLAKRVQAKAPGEVALLSLERDARPLALPVALAARTTDTRFRDLPQFHVIYDTSEWEAFRALMRSLPPESQEKGAFELSRFLGLSSNLLSARARRQVEELKQEMLRPTPVALPATP